MGLWAPLAVSGSEIELGAIMHAVLKYEIWSQQFW